MGVVLARKDASVHPMEQVKTIVPTSKPYFSLFCSPCYHVYFFFQKLICSILRKGQKNLMHLVFQKEIV